MHRKRREHDVAYVCFLFSGLTMLFADALGASLREGAIILFPLALASLLAMVVATILSMRLWRHWPLGILSAMSVLFIAELFGEYGSVAFHNAVPMAYGLGVVTITLAWFLVLRWSRAWRERALKS